MQRLEKDQAEQRSFENTSALSNLEKVRERHLGEGVEKHEPSHTAERNVK